MIDHAVQLAPPTYSAPFSVVLAHDWLVARRGGELVLDAIIQTLHKDKHAVHKLYSMFDDGSPITPAIDDLPKTISRLNTLPQALRRWQLFRYPSAVKYLSKQLAKDHRAKPIDLIISTHSAAIKAINLPTPPAKKQLPHICYCHTPARYLWSQQAAYASPGLKGRLRTLGLRAATPTLRKWDLNAANAVSHFVANSTHTQAQIKEHYHRDSTIIHPPVRTDFFVPPNDPTKRTDTLLLVSALEPYKRVDLAIDAAVIANKELVIVGSGSHEAQLRKHAQRTRAKHRTTQRAKPLIRFAGQLTDAQLLAHYQTASAFLFPQIEDFGITAVEAQAAGCPVIARNAGGALDTVIEAKTGVFFDDPTPESIAHAIEQTPTHNDTAAHCRTNALRFSEHIFSNKLRAVINQALNARESE